MKRPDDVTTLHHPDNDESEYLLGPEHACPECGAYYTLCIGAVPMPFPLSDYGTDEEQTAWEEENNFNISTCSSCGWRSDDD